MDPHWIATGVIGAIAGFLAKKVIEHGEELAGLRQHKDDVLSRLERQDGVMVDMNRKLDAIMFKVGARQSPPPSGG